VKRVYVALSDKDGKIFFDNSKGEIRFQPSELLRVFDEAARRGFRVHSIVTPPEIGGFVVFVEK
jgi:hypothetical protein